MRITLSKKLAVAAVAPLLMTGLVACGGDDSDTAESTSSSSSEASETAEEEPVEAAGEEIDPGEFVSSMMSAMEGASTAHVSLALEGGGQGMSAEGDMDYAKNPPEMKLVMSIPQMGDGIEMIMTGGFMYIKMPGLSEGKYIKTAMDDPTNPMGDLTGQMDPRSQFENMEAALKSVTLVGEEEVDGETLTHYTMVLDGSKVPNQQGTTMPDELAYDVWLDGDNRMRQLKIDSAGTVITSTVSDWGKEIAIKAPKDNQIMEMPTP
jgi:hypothetical protein